jgi:hypothetical protein
MNKMIDSTVRDIGDVADVPVVEVYVDAGEKFETDQMNSRKRVDPYSRSFNTS